MYAAVFMDSSGLDLSVASGFWPMDLRFESHELSENWNIPTYSEVFEFGLKPDSHCAIFFSWFLSILYSSAYLVKRVSNSFEVMISGVALGSECAVGLGVFGAVLIGKGVVVG